MTLCRVQPANETRFVMLVRHPTDRLFSEFRFYLGFNRLSKRLEVVRDPEQRASISRQLRKHAALHGHMDAHDFHRFVLLKLAEWRRCLATHAGELDADRSKGGTGTAAPGSHGDRNAWRCMFAAGRTVLNPHMGIYAALLRRWFDQVGYRADYLMVRAPKHHTGARGHYGARRSLSRCAWSAATRR